MTDLAGYAHPLYARSLSEFGEPVAMVRSAGWVLLRPIPGTSFRDAMGPYPIFSCANWSGLRSDIEDLGGDIVSLTLVPDPFGDFDESLLRRSFDRVVPFKHRFVVDLGVPLERRVSRHHWRMARKALRRMEVEVCDEPVRFLDEWTALYGNTIRRHQLRGVKAFSRAAFARQLATPGIVMLRAVYRGATAAINLWFEQGHVAYGHLAGISDSGYELGASYALYWHASEWFAGRRAWLDLGGASGTAASSGGLDYFKRGWSTGIRQTWLCGSVIDRRSYHSLADRAGGRESGYFPAYRAGELV